MKAWPILILGLQTWTGWAQENTLRSAIDAHAAAFTIPGYPDWIEIDKQSVWISNEGLNVMQRIDPSTGEITATVKVNAPCAAFVIAFGSVWVASCVDHTIVRIASDNQGIQAVIPLTIADAEGSLAAAAGSIWVLSDKKGKLSRINERTNKVEATVDVAPNSFAAAAGYGSIWITNTGENPNSNGSVQRIDPETNSVIATIEVGKQPRFLAAGEGGVWIFNQTDGSVSRIDPHSNKVMATILCDVPGTGGDISAGEGYVWVRAKKELLMAIDPKTNKVVNIFGPPAGSGAVRAGQGAVWVTAHDINKIWRLNPATIKGKK